MKFEKPTIFFRISRLAADWTAVGHIADFVDAQLSATTLQAPFLLLVPLVDVPPGRYVNCIQFDPATTVMPEGVVVMPRSK